MSCNLFAHRISPVFQLPDLRTFSTGHSVPPNASKEEGSIDASGSTDEEGSLRQGRGHSVPLPDLIFTSLMEISQFFNRKRAAKLKLFCSQVGGAKIRCACSVIPLNLDFFFFQSDISLTEVGLVVSKCIYGRYVIHDLKNGKSCRRIILLCVTVK